MWVFTHLAFTVDCIEHKTIVPSLSLAWFLIFTLWNLFLQQAELTQEEQLAEKLRVKKLQEDADLELAKDAFGKKEPSKTNLTTLPVSFLQVKIK